MKKIILTIIISLFTVTVFAADAAKTTGIGLNPAAFGAAQKEKDKADKEIDALVEKYKTAADADKKNIKADLTKKVTAREEARIKKEREEIARQQEKLKTWTATLDNTEKNKTAFVSEKVDNLIAGKKEETPWEKLKADTIKKSADIKTKTLQKAAAANK